MNAETDCTEIFVSEIEQCSIAERDGRIKEGDQILQINGRTVSSREQAVASFAETRKDITLLLARPRIQCHRLSAPSASADSAHCDKAVAATIAVSTTTVPPSSSHNLTASDNALLPAAQSQAMDTQRIYYDLDDLPGSCADWLPPPNFDQIDNVSAPLPLPLCLCLTRNITLVLSCSTVHKQSPVCKHV